MRLQSTTAICLLIASSALLGLEPSPSPAKRVEIDKTSQVLRAYEGDRLVLESRVSTGRGNSTPSGSYRVQGKQRMHYSKRYDNAPMPYSVQVSGHYFIHGFTSVPSRPASHGCIRLPLTEENPAKRFYEWVELGTPVEITGRWKQGSTDRPPGKAGFRPPGESESGHHPQAEQQYALDDPKYNGCQARTTQVIRRNKVMFSEFSEAVVPCCMAAILPPRSPAVDAVAIPLRNPNLKETLP